MRIRATIELMDAPAEQVARARLATTWPASASRRARSPRRSRARVPGFTIDCEPDFRQAIADSWPRSIDDAPARDWGWQPRYDLEAMVDDMLHNLRASMRS